MSAGNIPRLIIAPSRERRSAAQFVRLSQLRRLRECEQVAAVCYRLRNQEIEFLLVNTSGKRWTFPKGSAEPGLTHAQAAALEAFEEAGVHGRIEEAPFTRYFRGKRIGRRSAAKDLAVNAYLCEVSRLESPQEAGRNPTWFAASEAKRHLRKGREADLGAEMARVVDRAARRIQQLRGAMRIAEVARQRALHKKDALQKVQFTVIEGGAGKSAEPVRRSNSF